MFGSIYIGLSGLNAYSDGLRAVSNNISNLNTVGFRSSDVRFSDFFGVRNSGSLQYGNSTSGAGYGVTLDSLSINFGQGELRQTDRDLDLAIDGSGFMVLLDGDEAFYTRTGSFSVDQDGFVVLNGTDMRLALLDESGRPVAVNIDANRTNAPETSTTVRFADNLSSTATTHSIPNIRLFDEGGEEHVWSLTFSREETTPNEWTVTATDSEGNEIGEQTLLFSGGAIEAGSESLAFTDDESGLSIEFDFTDVTSFSSGTVSSLRAADIDGHPTGSIARLAVNAEGVLEIAYTNEETLALGAVALADFRDPQTLEQRSQGLFAHNGFGQVRYLPSEDRSVGAIQSRRLEASNVDLGAQFSDLILVQRGFQASSQIISVSNDMIQQLFGIRGQG